MKKAVRSVVDDIEIIKEERWGRFHVVEAKHSDGVIGIGISRRSSHDRPDDIKGLEIAKGRARKAVVKKILGEKITCQFMG